MRAESATASPNPLALVVHSDMAALSKFQAAFSRKGFTTIVARDLPTALLAITQHYFQVAIVCSHLAEGGDGWPLAGVLHLVFPRSFIAVVSPFEPDVLTLQAAINYGAREVYQQTSPVEEIVDSIVAQVSSSGNEGSNPRLQ